jgi:hypothetical protein
MESDLRALAWRRSMQPEEGNFAAMETSVLIANEVTDDDLLGMLDRPLWLARAGSVALGLPCTLRKALCRAYAVSGEGSCSVCIVKLANDDIRIGADQITRLRQRIGLTGTI